MYASPKTYRSSFTFVMTAYHNSKYFGCPKRPKQTLDARYSVAAIASNIYSWVAIRLSNGVKPYIVVYILIHSGINPCGRDDPRTDLWMMQSFGDARLYFALKDPSTQNALTRNLRAQLNCRRGCKIKCRQASSAQFFASNNPSNLFPPPSSRVSLYLPAYIHLMLTPHCLVWIT